MTAPAQRPAPRRYGGLSDQERRDERQRRFLEAGLETFGSLGYSATTTRRLCAEAGLTQRYFYQAFEGMEALFVAVAKQLSEELRQQIITAMMSAEPEPEAMIRSSLGAYFHIMRNDPRVARILLIEVFSVSQQTELLARHFMDELSDLLQGILETRFPALLRQGISPRLLTTGLIGATHHIALRWTMSGYAEPLEQVVETALQICRNALDLTTSPLPNIPRNP